MTNKLNSSLIANLQILQRHNTLNKLYKKKIQNQKYRNTIQTDTPTNNSQKKIHKKSLELPQIETPSNHISDKVLLRQAIKYHNEVVKKRRLYPISTSMKKQSSNQNFKNLINKEEIKALEKEISQKVFKKLPKQNITEKHLLKQTSIIFPSDQSNEGLNLNTYRDLFNPENSIFSATKRNAPGIIKGTYYQPKYKSLKKSKSKSLYDDYNITTYIRLQQNQQLPISFQMPLFQASEKQQILKRHSQRIRSYLTNVKQQNLSINIPFEKGNSTELKTNYEKNNKNFNSTRKRQNQRYTINLDQQCSPWEYQDHDKRRFDQMKLKELLNKDM